MFYWNQYCTYFERINLSYNYILPERIVFKRECFSSNRSSRVALWRESREGRAFRILRHSFDHRVDNMLFENILCIVYTLIQNNEHNENVHWHVFISTYLHVFLSLSDRFLKQLFLSNAPKITFILWLALKICLADVLCFLNIFCLQFFIPLDIASS